MKNIRFGTYLTALFLLVVFALSNGCYCGGPWRRGHDGGRFDGGRGDDGRGDFRR